MSPDRWIVIPNWFGDQDSDEGLQHYRDRDPVWIKNYRRLLAKDEYRDLSGHCRAILHGLWLEYASTDGRLRVDSSSISHRLALRVTTAQLESLNHAGFVHFSASKPLALSEQRASPEKRREEKKREEQVKTKDQNQVQVQTEARPPARAEANGHDPLTAPDYAAVIHTAGLDWTSIDEETNK